MFKLVRIDDEDHREIDLIDGKQVIGRDQMFDCDDKRISRQHAELEATVDSVSIKALHLNPCFFVNNEMTEAQVIKQNTSVNGYHGDKIGFLPESHWYQIRNVACNNNLDLNEISPLKAIIETILLKKNNESVKEEPIVPATSIINSIEHNSETTDRSIEEPAQAENSPSLASATVEEESTQCGQPSDAGDHSSAKRCFVKEEPVSPVDAKKVKTEPDTEDKKPDINLPSTSGDVSGASGDQQSPPQPNQQPQKRERCMYGKDCYRRNPQHKAQFSHPGDADYGTGNQAECPYGYACIKKDPRHWRDHSHPYGMHPPPPPGKKKKRTRVVDSPQPIVTGKRARRTVTSTDAWSDSETEEEDPYGTDDSDDWIPPSDISSQDFSQTQ